jgi:hypothetical protein
MLTGANSRAGRSAYSSVRRQVERDGVGAFLVLPMTRETLPPSLLDFLNQKKPRVWSRSYCAGDLELELVAERELDSLVGVLRLRGVSLYEVENAEALCGVLDGTLHDLTDDQRTAIAGSTGPDGGHVFIFESPEGRRFTCVATGLEFYLRPWFDSALTERVQRLSAGQSYSPGEAVRSHIAGSAAELLGKEVVCWQCLRRFPFEKEFAECPGCGSSASPCSPERLLRSFLHAHVGEELYERSGCGLLQDNHGAAESYRLIVYSYWLSHRIVEVKRMPLAVRLVAKAWNWQEKKWVETADQGLSPAEWRRFSQLTHLAPFWELPPHGGHYGFDGADYVLEGMRQGCYHFVRRWCPEPSADQENFSFACECLLEMAARETEALSS